MRRCEEKGREVSRGVKKRGGVKGVGCAEGERTMRCE